MKKLCQKILYTIMAIQETLLRKRFELTMKSSMSNSTTKTVFNNGSRLTLSAKTEQNKQKVENNVAVILQKYQNNPEKLMEFMNSKGTKVCRIKNAEKILKIISEKEGLIYSQSGLKALFINILTQNGISLKSKTIFIVDEKPVDTYFMAHQFHIWYSMKTKLPGFDENTQKNLTKLINNTKDEDIKNLNLDEILALKEAIARDVEAINFTVKLAKNTEGSKKAMQKILTGG